MNKYAKRLPIALAAALTISGFAGMAAPMKAEAATSGYVRVHGSNTKISSKTVWAGGLKVNLDYKYGSKKSGISGKWTSASPSKVMVDSSTGVVTALKNGNVKVTFTPNSSKYKKISVTIYSRVRATEVNLHEDSANGAIVSGTILKQNESKKFYVSMPTKTGAKSTYFVHYTVSSPEAISVTNGTESRGVNGSWSGLDYGRNLSVSVNPNAPAGVATFTVWSSQNKDSNKVYKYQTEKKTYTITIPAKPVEKTELTAKQTGSKTVYITGVPAEQLGKSLYLNGNTGIEFKADPKAANVASYSAVNADGTYNVTLKSALPFTTGVTNVTDATNKVVASFTAQSERIEKVEFADSVKLDAAGTVTGTFSLKNQFGETYVAPAEKKVNNSVILYVNGSLDSTLVVNQTPVNGVYTFYTNAVKAGDRIYANIASTVSNKDNITEWAGSANKDYVVPGVVTPSVTSPAAIIFSAGKNKVTLLPADNADVTASGYVYDKDGKVLFDGSFISARISKTGSLINGKQYAVTSISGFDTKKYTGKNDGVNFNVIELATGKKYVFSFTPDDLTTGTLNIVQNGYGATINSSVSVYAGKELGDNGEIVADTNYDTVKTFSFYPTTPGGKLADVIVTVKPVSATATDKTPVVTVTGVITNKDNNGVILFTVDGKEYTVTPSNDGKVKAEMKNLPNKDSKDTKNTEDNKNIDSGNKSTTESTDSSNTTNSESETKDDKTSENQQVNA